MENKIEELKKLGYDITSIIEGVKNQNALKHFYKVYGSTGLVAPEWTEESICKFSNTIYRIVTRNKKDIHGHK